MSKTQVSAIKPFWWSPCLCCSLWQTQSFSLPMKCLHLTCDAPGLHHPHWSQEAHFDVFISPFHSWLAKKSLEFTNEFLKPLTKGVLWTLPGHIMVWVSRSYSPAVSHSCLHIPSSTAVVVKWGQFCPFPQEHLGVLRLYCYNFGETGCATSI